MQTVLERGSDASSPPVHQEMWLQIAPLLDDAMERLGSKDHDALVLRFFENRNFREVGLALGASEDAAKMRVSRALEKLRNFFTKRGVSSTTATIAGTISTNSVQAAPVALAKTVTAVAIAKGAAASVSTLTLINGALKIMAWTKAKTVVAVGIVAFFALGTAIVAFNESNSPSGNSKVAVSVLNTTNYNGHLFYVLSFVNHDRKPIWWRGIDYELQGNPMHLAPIQNIYHTWEFSSNLVAGQSVIAAVGVPTETGEWRVCVYFTPDAFANIWEGPTNLFTAKSPW